VVTVNRQDRVQDFALRLDGGRWHASLPPHSIATYLTAGPPPAAHG
jgi:hypothetical protein